MSGWELGKQTGILNLRTDSIYRPSCMDYAPATEQQREAWLFGYDISLEGDARQVRGVDGR